ncbi:MAG: PilW family protein [Caldimonas sp.]
MRLASTHRKQRGFTLIEIMVGCAISVVGLLVIFQTLAVWNRHSQTSMAGGDADTSGTLGMFSFERDIRLGGVGVATGLAAPMGACPVSVTGGAVTSFPLAPVVITFGAGGAPDTIDVLYGNSSFFTDTEKVLSSTATSNYLRRRNGFHQGDLAIVAGQNGGAPACSLVEITDTSDADGFTVKHESAVSYVSYYAAGGAAGLATFNPATPYPVVSNATMFSLGPAPRLNRWQIGNDSAGVPRLLQRSDLIHNTAAFDVAEGVINLKAEYGVDANNDGQIAGSEWTTTAPTDWTTLLAIRVAMLVRSGQFERSPDAGASDVAGEVTPAAPTWSGGTFLMTDVNGNADTSLPNDPNNWRYYRYRVYEKVIPLRNMLWN